MPSCAGRAWPAKTCSTATSAAWTPSPGGLLNAVALIQSGELVYNLQQRYAGWDGPLGQRILGGELDFGALADHVHATNADLSPRSGRQELLENIVARFLK